MSKFKLGKIIGKCQFLLENIDASRTLEYNKITEIKKLANEIYNDDRIL